MELLSPSISATKDTKHMLYSETSLMSLVTVCMTLIHFHILSFQDPHAEEFEDKEWTFVIENVSAFITLLLFW